MGKEVARAHLWTVNYFDYTSIFLRLRTPPLSVSLLFTSRENENCGYTGDTIDRQSKS